MTTEIHDATINLSIVSHTNIGKTTLARTLLNRDIGEIADRAHVTVTADPYPLIDVPSGARLILWDTPGFGNSVNLAKRLEARSNPLGWFLGEVWDRVANKSQWLNQKALLHVRDITDVVLYLVNAAQLPEAAPYVAAEMKILKWIGKPVIVLLNQMGEPKPSREERLEVQRWKDALKGCDIVKDVLAMDAFARCWVQEFALFESIGKALPPVYEKPYAELKAAWREHRKKAFYQSAEAVSAFINARVSDEAQVEDISLLDRVRLFGKSVGLFKNADMTGDPAKKAQTELVHRAEDDFNTLARELLAVNGLTGQVEPKELFGRLKASWHQASAGKEAKAGLAGAIGAGTAGGLSADLMTGGLTLGTGALIGAILGAAGAVGAVHMYSRKKEQNGVTAAWSHAALEGFMLQSVLLYLAVAHFGRGRGNWTESEYPPAWKETVEKVLKNHQAEDKHLPIMVQPVLEETLKTLYPGIVL